LDDDFIQEFLKNSPFKLQETPGKMEVALTRKFKDEEIEVLFTVDSPPSPEFGEEEEEPATVPAMVTVLVSKPSKGTITFNCSVDNESIFINQVIHTDDSKLATEDTAQADYDRTNIYPGPSMDDITDVPTPFFFLLFFLSFFFFFFSFIFLPSFTNFSKF